MAGNLLHTTQKVKVAIAKNVLGRSRLRHLNSHLTYQLDLYGYWDTVEI